MINMLEVLVLFSLMLTLIGLFNAWKKEKGHKLRTIFVEDAPAPSRQSQRYHKTSVFGMVRWGSHEELPTFHAFSDRFTSFTDVTTAMRRAGVNTCDLIIGIDFTASNEWQGRATFKKNCLHSLMSHPNPYQKVISILGSTLEPLRNNRPILAYGFGDSTTKGTHVFNLCNNGNGFPSFKDLLHRYNEVVPCIKLSGPTSYRPLIRRAIDVVHNSNRYYILFIISDGQLNADDKATMDAIIEASEYPLSIVMVGVGDGPWSLIEQFDDQLPERVFDNFQFVDYNKTISEHPLAGIGVVQTHSPRFLRRQNSEAVFALHALMEIPDQYKSIKDLGYLHA